MRHLAPRTLTVALLLGLLAACSTDTPTAPERTPAPPPGSAGPSATWNIAVTTNQASLEQSSAQPATINIQVRRADNGQAPPVGATIVVSASLGDFNSSGSGEQVLTVTLSSGGLAQLLYYAGEILGTDVISAQLESSVGRVAIEIIEPVEQVVASFTVVNPDGNRSVQFLNTSTGDPTRFRWEFGDGATSNAENPGHIYAQGGTYVVRFTASKPGSSDTVTQALTLTDDPAPEAGLAAAFSFLVNGLQVFFFDESSGCDGATACSYTWLFGDGGSSTAASPTYTYSAPGTYTVILRVDRGEDTSSASQTVTIVDPGPLTADFSFLVNGLQVFFFDDSTGCDGSCTYLWLFGDGGTSTAADPTHTYTAAGAYTVNLRVDRGAASSSVSKIVTVP